MNDAQTYFYCQIFARETVIVCVIKATIALLLARLTFGFTTVRGISCICVNCVCIVCTLILKVSLLRYNYILLVVGWVGSEINNNKVLKALKKSRKMRTRRYYQNNTMRMWQLMFNNNVTTTHHSLSFKELSFPDTSSSPSWSHDT